MIAPLKAHIFDPEYTKLINAAKLRNSCMLRIIDLMSLTRASGKRNSRRGRISYANLGINQMGAVYEALLSYRGFIAQQNLYEVKRAGDSFNELDVGYFVSESELAQYTQEERVRYESGDKRGKLRMYAKGTFIYRLAGREREKSASYYTPEVLTKCLVKYALKELLKGKSADDILHLTICEPAMGSAAFLNEAINQLAEAYISRKEQETGEIIGYEDRFNQLQKVKMFIADRNVYGVDLNPVAVELAEVSLWLNTIYPNGFVPWFGTQLVNGNSLIGARRQCYRVSSLQATSKGLRWYEKAPERVPLGTERKRGKLAAQIYHFLLGDPGMCSYTDKVIKQLEPAKIKFLNTWNKAFIVPYSDDDIETLKKLSKIIDKLWKDQIALRQQLLPAGEREQNIPCDLKDPAWFDKIDASGGAVFFASGVFYYFLMEQVRELVQGMADAFPGGVLVFDAANRTAVKMIAKTWLRTAKIKDVGAYFAVSDAKSELSPWDSRLQVSSRGYMLGYNDLKDPSVSGFFRFLAKVGDNGMKMQIVKIGFGDRQ